MDSGVILRLSITYISITENDPYRNKTGRPTGQPYKDFFLPERQKTNKYTRDRIKVFYPGFAFYENKVLLCKIFLMFFAYQRFVTQRIYIRLRSKTWILPAPLSLSGYP